MDNLITWRETEFLIKSWRERATNLGYKRGTKTYARYEVEFFTGAIAMLIASNRRCPAIWAEIILCGRSLSDTLIAPTANPPPSTSESDD